VAVPTTLKQNLVHDYRLRIANRLGQQPCTGKLLKEEREDIMAKEIDKRKVYTTFDYCLESVEQILFESTNDEFSVGDLVDTETCPEFVRVALDGPDAYWLGKDVGFIIGLCHAWGLSTGELIQEAAETSRPSTREIVGEERWTEYISKKIKRATKPKQLVKNNEPHSTPVDVQNHRPCQNRTGGEN
jgi:hypothetical protein